MSKEELVAELQERDKSGGGGKVNKKSKRKLGKAKEEEERARWAAEQAAEAARQELTPEEKYARKLQEQKYERAPQG